MMYTKPSLLIIMLQLSYMFEDVSFTKARVSMAERRSLQESRPET